MMRPTKSQLMQLVLAGRGIESFTHSEEGVFNVTAMRQQAIDTGREPVLLPVDPAVVADIQSRYDWEEARVQELMASMAAEPGRADPGIIVCYKDETMLPIDGVHRFIASSRIGYTDMLFWLFAEDEVLRPATGGITLQGWGTFSIIDGKRVPHSS